MSMPQYLRNQPDNRYYPELYRPPQFLTPPQDHQFQAANYNQDPRQIPQFHPQDPYFTENRFDSRVIPYNPHKLQQDTEYLRGPQFRPTIDREIEKNEELDQIRQNYLYKKDKDYTDFYQKEFERDQAMIEDERRNSIILQQKNDKEFEKLNRKYFAQDFYQRQRYYDRPGMNDQTQHQFYKQRDVNKWQYYDDPYMQAQIRQQPLYGKYYTTNEFEQYQPARMAHQPQFQQFPIREFQKSEPLQRPIYSRNQYA